MMVVDGLRQMTADEAILTATEEGLTLLRSSRSDSSTGYRGVHFSAGGQYQANHWTAGKYVRVDQFSTKEEAALAIARFSQGGKPNTMRARLDARSSAHAQIYATHRVIVRDDTAEMAEGVAWRAYGGIQRSTPQNSIATQRPAHVLISPVPHGWPPEVEYTEATYWSDVSEALRFSPQTAAIRRKGKRKAVCSADDFRLRMIISEQHPCCGERGTFANRNILAGETLFNYTGHIRVVMQGEPDTNASKYLLILHSDDRRGLYVDIDAEHAGNMSRFVNDYHGLTNQPNARFCPYFDPYTGEKCIQVESTMPIKTDEEVLADYGSKYYQRDDKGETRSFITAVLPVEVPSGSPVAASLPCRTEMHVTVECRRCFGRFAEEDMHFNSAVCHLIPNDSEACTLRMPAGRRERSRPEGVMPG